MKIGGSPISINMCIFFVFFIVIVLRGISFIPSQRKRSHILILDEVGRRTVELIDGKKDLNTIADTIALEFHFDKEAAAAALIAFVIILQKKNIILISEN
jgi:hypothetical protein